MTCSRGLLSGVVLVCVLVFSACSASSAGARSRTDRSSAVDYLRAVHREEISEGAEVHAGRRAGERFARRVRGECSDALDGALEGKAQRRLAVEVYAAGMIAVAAPDRSAQRRYVRSISSLRWRSRRMAMLVAKEVRQQKRRLRLRVPNLCAAAMAWAASGFGRLPHAAQLFARRFSAATPADPAAFGIRTWLRGVMTQALGRLQRRIGKLEIQLDMRQIPVMNAVDRALCSALGLSGHNLLIIGVPLRG